MSKGLVYYAFRVAPLKEFIVERILKDLGYKTTVPSEIKLVRAARHVKRKVERRYVIMSRYVFLGFPANEEPPWGPLIRLQIFQCIVCATPAQPVKISEEALLKVLKDPAQGLADLVNIHKGFAVGTRVVIQSGAFVGFESVVEQIDGNTAMLTIQIFGRPTVVHISLDELSAA
jgi:transcription antitermination factor NusG